MPKQTFDNLKDEKKQRIIQSALVEFKEKGYEKGNIEVIAKNANVSKGSMYQYFIDKKDLYLYLIAYVIEVTQREQKKCMNEGQITDIYELFYEGNKALGPVMNKYLNESLFVDAAESETDGDIRTAIKKISMTYAYDMYIPYIEQQKQAGKIRKDIDSEMILVYLEGISTRFKRYLMGIAEKSGKNVVEMEFEAYEGVLHSLKELLKNGMMGKS